ncbi:response regulator transcription factor [Candidatus Enterococcus ikei]|uniref:Response regulator transcription factor n=1 Tax=Candidatus Enterococcus ikei TaxID=2815326 RepID=A0ABS3H1S4_9ENTE|nr:response regulator transcription factor [Enterococcus sp. DIV0869a]MBO0440634.1 response regulator transcription factor [Enterococcus sp. DIV0869a]
MRNEKILVVDDDPAIRRLIWKSLQSTGLLVYQSDTIEKTIDIMNRVTFQLFLLDVSLEHENDGYHLAQLIRERQPLTPIIFVSGKKSEQDIISGLESGGDVYLSKPFAPNVLRAQVISTLNRTEQLLTLSQKREETMLREGVFSFDKNQYQFSKNGEIVNMTSKEIMMILFFMENPYQVFSKEQIYASVWSDGDMDKNLITVYINYLRNKIEDDPKKPKYLQTVWGIGYLFNPEGKEAGTSIE